MRNSIQSKTWCQIRLSKPPPTAPSRRHCVVRHKTKQNAGLCGISLVKYYLQPLFQEQRALSLARTMSECSWGSPGSLGCTRSVLAVVLLLVHPVRWSSNRSRTTEYGLVPESFVALLGPVSSLLGSQCPLLGHSSHSCQLHFNYLTTFN